MNYVTRRSAALMLPFVAAALMWATAASGQTTTPGAPATGAGGMTTVNTLMLFASAGVAAGGLLYLSRKQKSGSAS